jgi:hypothetical protein
MSIRDKIAERSREIYRDRYGSRSPDTLSSQEIEKINHDAAVAVQKEIKKRAKEK